MPKRYGKVVCLELISSAELVYQETNDLQYQCHFDEVLQGHTCTAD